MIFKYLKTFFRKYLNVPKILPKSEYIAHPQQNVNCQKMSAATTQPHRTHLAQYNSTTLYQNKVIYNLLVPSIISILCVHVLIAFD